MAYLEINEGPLAGTHFTLEGKVTIGRNTASTLHLNDVSVSRQHAEIWHKENYYAVVDLGSANGSFVNGEQLHRFVPRPLYDNDELILGNSRLFFHAQGEQPPGSEKSASAISPPVEQPLRPVSQSLSVVMTQDDRKPHVNATIDASRSMLFDPAANESPERLLAITKRLQAMVTIAIDLGAVFKPDALADHIMSSIFDIFPHADRAFIMAYDTKTAELKPLSARSRSNHGTGSGEFPVSKTILQTVIEERQSILLSDARSDSRFAEQQSIVNLSIRSLMCAPFICKSELLGVIGVDTMSRQHAFSADDLGMLTGIASQAAVSLKNADLYSTVENETQIRTQLSRYLSRDVVEGIISGTIPLRLGGEKKWGTILFCDIVGFTSIAENLSALEVVEKLNRYYALVTDIITRNHGTLHKFGGDMVMAFWNVMVPDDRACLNTIRCGLEMQNAIFFFGIELENEGQRPIHLGIGCNTGEFAGGNIGGTHRMEYTVIGDNVNLAQRIETLASRWQVLVSEETYATAKNFCSAIRLQPVLVKGKVLPITVYSIRGILQHDESMLLTIPLVIMTPEGTISGSGLATLYKETGTSTELHVVTVATIPPWSRLLIQFDLPELSVSPRLTGTISAAFRQATEHNTAYTHIILSELTGDPAAFSLLRSGACSDSRKSWGDMRRH
jgi:adenylate cyclase